MVTSGCGASVQVHVQVQAPGTGAVSVTVVLPHSTAGGVEDLRPGLLPVADLRRAGWSVQGPVLGPGGSTEVGASHPFSALTQIPVLLAEVAGSGPASSRPFRLSVRHDHGLLQDHYVASGKVDLSCSFHCFDDPALRARLGFALGLPPAQLAQLLGPHAATELTFSFVLSLPGTVKSTNSSAAPAPTRGPGGAGTSHNRALRWAVALGSSTPVMATSEVTNLAFIRVVLAAVGAGALLVVITAALLILRRRGRKQMAATSAEASAAKA